MATQSSFKNMLLTLMVIALAASLLLSFVYSSTKAPIDKAKADKVNSAIKAVLPEFDNQPSEAADTLVLDGGQLMLYRATHNGEAVGTAIRTFSKNGFGGTIELMVGFLPDSSIHSIAVVGHNETPGLGDKIDPQKSDFSLQFAGKRPGQFQLSVKKDGGDVDAITASTISSRAYCDAVQRAYTALQKGGAQ
ncbi:MAG: RnfABCDGE type electron transport complex subunit G [Bacteroidales bacterium]|nr:RnfABCDGE type electron transport complex subunit G [Bacteroidales bacterium]